MTKYAEMVVDPQKIRYHLEKAMFLATEGRPGPCWLDIPLNVQAAIIDTEKLNGFKPDNHTNEDLKEVIDKVIEKLKKAKRPVINAGNGIRISGGFDIFKKLTKKLNFPVVTGWNSIDLISNNAPLYTGRAGIMGDRPGNFAIQNSDLVLSLGSRLSIRQVGYNYKTWAREAYTIVVDIDSEELKKPTIHTSLTICADVKKIMDVLYEKIPDEKLFTDESWLTRCQNWKKTYPVVMSKHYESKGKTNVYAFVKELSDYLPVGCITVVGNGSACVVGSHAYTIKDGQRFIINSGVASMGYGLPAAIGACIANKRNELICLTGDGSIQMNLQELQTILTNKLPIKIFVINNEGYHSIRQTQTKFFGEPLVGIGKESNDLDFPELKKMAYAYGYEYHSCSSNNEIKKILSDVFKTKHACICEIFVSKDQMFEPKAATKKLDDGTLVSAPLEDMSPFLPKDELSKNMIIPGF